MAYWLGKVFRGSLEVNSGQKGNLNLITYSLTPKLSNIILEDFYVRIIFSVL